MSHLGVCCKAHRALWLGAAVQGATAVETRIDARAAGRGVLELIASAIIQRHGAADVLIVDNIMGTSIVKARVALDPFKVTVIIRRLFCFGYCHVYRSGCFYSAQALTVMTSHLYYYAQSGMEIDDRECNDYR